MAMSPIMPGPSKWTSALILGLGVAIGALIVVALMIGSKPRKQEPRPLSALELAQGWLECIDCQAPFLRRLHDLSPTGQDSVVRLLGVALLKGPDSTRRARHERDLARAWASDSVYRDRLHLAPPSTSQKAFLDRYREGFYAKYRGRAAMALGVLRTPRALAALDSAAQIRDTTFGDSVVQQRIERARSDSTGLEALDHYPGR
jgi:hypothetical protein